MHWRLRVHASKPIGDHPVKYVLVGALILLVLVACSALISHFFKPRKHRLVGFREYVKNPELKREMSDYRAERESLQVPDDISDAEIRQMVDRLFVHADDDFNFDRVELVGARAVPFLVDALDKPETWKTTFPEGGHVFDPGSPFERICRLLDPVGPAEAARSLSKYTDHTDDRFRQLTALALGNIGTRECIDAIGATAKAGVLREATSLFGSDGPSENNDKRHHQLAGFSQQQDETLETLNRKYYACEENIESLLAQYALSHRDHFVRTE
jgi:hypothetical protein